MNISNKQGNDYFYQWDSDQKLVLSPDLAHVATVHFEDNTSDVAMMVDVVNGEANVPNILLQKAEDIVVWVYIDEEQRTAFSKTFKVYERQRPSGYVYTETEVQTYSKLNARVADVEKVLDVMQTTVDIPPKGQRGEYLVPFIKPTTGEPQGGNFSLEKLLDAEATQAELDELGRRITDNAEAIASNKSAQATTDRLQNEEIALKANAADTYTKIKTDSLLSEKADLTYVNGKLNKKVNETDQTKRDADQDAKITANDTAIAQETTARLDAYTYTRRNIPTSELAKLKEAIASGNPEKYGFHEGDYFNVNGYTYVLADYDHWFGGYDAYGVVNKRHWGVLVNTEAKHAWNSSGNTEGGYAGSELHAYLVDTVLPKIEADLNALDIYLIANQRLYSNAIDRNRVNRYGSASGCASSWAWNTNQKISAPTEIEIYGSTAWSSSGYDTGEGCKPLKACQRFRYNELLPWKYFWLRDIASASRACYAHGSGIAGHYGVSGASDVVGLIGIY